MHLQVNDDAPSAEWRALAGACAILRGAVRVGIGDSEGSWVACGQLVPAGDVGIFGNDATLSSARGKGAHTALILARMAVAATRPFAFWAAEVAPGSTSERNYLRRGFDIAHTRVHYTRAFA